MKLKDLLLEAYVNLWGKDEIKPYIDEIWDMLQLSYSKLPGGFATANTKEELLDKVNLVKAVRKNGKIVAVKLYRDSNGRKGIAAGTDGTKQGKLSLFKMIEEDMKLERAWAEVSGKPEELYRRYGGIPIPNEFAEEILDRKIISKDPDGYHYTREINGVPYRKIIYGSTPELKKLVKK